MKNVLEYLENSAKRLPEKLACKDEKTSCTFSELMKTGRSIGYEISRYIEPENPVAVFMDKSVLTLQCFVGAVYAGGFYTLIDPSFPEDRVKKMLSVLQPKVIITNKDNAEKLQGVKDSTGMKFHIILLDERRIEETVAIYNAECGGEKLKSIRDKMADTAPLYCNFTSGTTGVPKGVLVGHRSLIDFIDVFTDLFGISEQDVIGNQAPFDFDVSVKDIYSSFKTGASLIIIPKAYFSFPNNVVTMLEENKVTTLIWAVSALVMLNRLHALKYITPSKVNKIMFSGEMMPVKQLNQWKKFYPRATFVNLYGPTEITCNCTYYILDRDFEEGERLPMGNAFPNEKVFLLDENDKLVSCDMHDVTGEICVAGTALAIGYYNDMETTAKAFVQNPVNPLYPEIIYRTGDLACYGEDGRLYFAGRKDFQIKHMGHRIELEEIESVLGAVEIVEQCCCFFDEEKNKVVAYYVGSEDKKAIVAGMKQKVPEYMVPNVFRNVEALPLNKNGKTDRKLLKEMYKKR